MRPALWSWTMFRGWLPWTKRNAWGHKPSWIKVYTTTLPKINSELVKENYRLWIWWKGMNGKQKRWKIREWKWVKALIIKTQIKRPWIAIRDLKYLCIPICAEILDPSMSGWIWLGCLWSMYDHQENIGMPICRRTYPYRWLTMQNANIGTTYKQNK